MDPADGAGSHDGEAECAVATPGERLALVHGLEPWCDDTAEAVVPDSTAIVSAVSASADDPKVPEIGERRKRSESGEIGERGESGESSGNSENGERGESGEFWDDEDDEDGEMYENDEYDEKSGTRGLGLGSGSRPMLAMLSGVDPHDADTSVHTASQSGAAARWVISQRACMAIILVLVVALAASLALVVRQGSTILQVAEGSVATAPGTQSGTQPGARSGAGAGSAQSSESHTMAESDGAGESSASAAPGAASSGTPDAVAPGSAAPTDTGGASSGAASPGAAGKVNLNTATSEELQTIKGVGPATAQKILDYRAAHGRFTSVDELLKIDGIGAKTLEKIRPEVTI